MRFRLDASLFCVNRQLISLQGECELIQTGLQKTPLVGFQQPHDVGQTDCHCCLRFLRTHQRKENSYDVWQGVRPGAGDLIVLDDPLDGRQADRMFGDDNIAPKRQFGI